MASEEAKYDIIKSTDVYEIRKYADRLAVEVVSTTGDNSFRKLFNYISVSYTHLTLPTSDLV